MSNLTPWQKYKQNLGNTRPWHMITEHNNFISDEDSNKRYSICKMCPEFISATTQCKKCGCIMKMKTKLPKATCPLNKW
jgi:hypothetical protein